MTENEITEEQYESGVEDVSEAHPIPVEKNKRSKRDRSPAQQEAFKKCLEAEKKGQKSN